MKKKIFLVMAICALACSVFIGSLLSQDVFAEGAVVPGSGGNFGQTCVNYCTTHIAWLYHRWDEDTSLSDVSELISGAHQIVGYAGSVGGTGGAIIPALCAKTGGYYRLAFYRQNGPEKLSNGIVYQKGQQLGVLSLEGLKTIAPNTFNIDTGYVTGVKIYGWDDAKAAFETMKEYDVAHGTNYTSGYDWSTSSGLGAFCFTPDTDGLENRVYYGSSNVAVNPPKSSGAVWKGTGITSTQKDVAYGPSVINVGDTATMTFSHKVLANKETNNVAWRVDRNWDKSSGYTPISSASSSGTANLTIKEDNYYTQGSTDYYDGTYYYTMRDVYSVTFDTPGTYTFCESLTVNNAGEYITKSCAVVEVKPVEYYTESNVAVGMPHVDTTHVTKTPTVVTDQLAYLKVGDEAPVTFSHVIFSSAKVNEVQWLVNRNFNICSNNTNNDRCTLTSRSNVGDVNNPSADPKLNNGNSGFSSVVANVSKLTEASGVTVDGKELWYSPQSVGGSYIGRPYTDNGGGHWFSWRDIYWAVFKKVGNYSGDGNNLCERLSIPGSGNEMTGACSNVKVPYNFKNSASIELGEDMVQVGGTVEIESATVTVGKKPNPDVWCANWVSTGERSGYCPDEYATQVDNATVKLIKYSASSQSGSVRENYGNYDSDLCAQGVIGGSSTGCEIETQEGIYLNQNNNTDGVTNGVQGIDLSERTVNAEAGKYYCVRLAIYPYTSGDNTNVDDKEGSHSWYISAPSCVQVGKKPTFQVWGGSVYSAGPIRTNSFIRTIEGEKKMFGSWGEQSVVARGLVSGFASGAATSKGSDINFCKYQTPLTFMNAKKDIAVTGMCSDNQIGNANIPADMSGKDAIKNYWWIPTVPVGDGNSFVEEITTGGEKIKYRYSSGDMTIDGYDNITDGTYVVRSDNGNIYINGNISYADKVYQKASEIPKMIIYAKNIYIGCGVNRVDAILIADGKIDTCANGNGINPGIDEESRSNQLKINGILMAGQVVFNRTYGGGSGLGATTPAEIVNYDTSALLWGRGSAEDNDNSLLTVVYQQELAPRY
ncbi:hypothetical protein J6X73_03215 [Candidatus Saccharibacteria bacterium]|nr:hypothetical protein [Candidatus Saccharibacteria bacterium]